MSWPGLRFSEETPCPARHTWRALRSSSHSYSPHIASFLLLQVLGGSVSSQPPHFCSICVPLANYCSLFKSEQVNLRLDFFPTLPPSVFSGLPLSFHDPCNCMVIALPCDCFFVWRFVWFGFFLSILKFYLFLATLHLCRFFAWTSSSCGEWGLLFSCWMQAPRCSGLSCCGAQTRGARASVVVAHWLNCSAACEIFPDQGLNPPPMHWQVDSIHCITRQVWSRVLTLGTW